MYNIFSLYRESRFPVQNLVTYVWSCVSFFMNKTKGSDTDTYNL